MDDIFDPLSYDEKLIREKLAVPYSDPYPTSNPTTFSQKVKNKLNQYNHIDNRKDNSYVDHNDNPYNDYYGTRQSHNSYGPLVREKQPVVHEPMSVRNMYKEENTIFTDKRIVLIFLFIIMVLFVSTYVNQQEIKTRLTILELQMQKNINT